MSQKITGLHSLEEELTSAESTALDEEQAFANETASPGAIASREA